ASWPRYLLRGAADGSDCIELDLSVDRARPTDDRLGSWLCGNFLRSGWDRCHAGLCTTTTAPRGGHSRCYLRYWIPCLESFVRLIDRSSLSLRDWRAVLALGHHPGGLLAASCGSPDSRESGSVIVR